jgi:hypothetical protein
MKEIVDAGLICYCGLNCENCLIPEGGSRASPPGWMPSWKGGRSKVNAGIPAEMSDIAVHREYPAVERILSASKDLRCECRGGGRPAECPVRDRCTHKWIEGCWKCGSFESYEKPEFLKGRAHDEAVIRNLRLLRDHPNAYLSGGRSWCVGEGRER